MSKHQDLRALSSQSVDMKGMIQRVENRSVVQNVYQQLVVLSHRCRPLWPPLLPQCGRIPLTSAHSHYSAGNTLIERDAISWLEHSARSRCNHNIIPAVSLAQS